MIFHFCPAFNTEDHSAMVKPDGGNSLLHDMKANDGMKDVGLLCHLLLHIPYACLIGVGKGLFINTTVHVKCRQMTGGKEKKEQNCLKGTQDAAENHTTTVGLGGLSLPQHHASGSDLGRRVAAG